jgi:hypothetical protein
LRQIIIFTQRPCGDVAKKKQAQKSLSEGMSKNLNELKAASEK